MVGVRIDIWMGVLSMKYDAWRPIGLSHTFNHLSGGGHFIKLMTRFGFAITSIQDGTERGFMRPVTWLIVETTAFSTRLSKLLILN